ncbi:UNVERIFIED_CONTAM: hypothetical protein FKN15_003557 [Acipenser sinensis]
MDMPQHDTGYQCTDDQLQGTKQLSHHPSVVNVSRGRHGVDAVPNVLIQTASFCIDHKLGSVHLVE